MDGVPPQEQAWGNSVWSRAFVSLPLLGATVFLFVDRANWAFREVWPPLLALAVLTGLLMRQSVHLNGEELLIRYPIGSRRLRRSEVASARFNYFGLTVQLRNGGTAFIFLAPRPSSTELSSGGRPEPGSASYEITRWAEGG